MNARIDRSRSEQLSAYLDGELDASEAQKIEHELEIDSVLRIELEKMMAADLIAKTQFEENLSEPVPFAIAQAIKNTPLGVKATKPVSSIQSTFQNFQVVAATVALLSIGVVGGYFIKDYTSTTAIVTANVSSEQNWVNEIAGYHAVYAKQKRHLVEVKASDDDHIKTWLSSSLKYDFNVPDLSASGLTFKGARLLVVGEKPVAQLMYTSGNGDVVALCVQKRIQSGVMNTKMATPINDNINGFDLFYWEHGGADLVLIGNQGFGDFTPLAISTNNQI